MDHFPKYCVQVAGRATQYKLGVIVMAFLLNAKTIYAVRHVVDSCKDVWTAEQDSPDGHLRFFLFSVLKRYCGIDEAFSEWLFPNFDDVAYSTWKDFDWRRRNRSTIRGVDFAIVFCRTKSLDGWDNEMCTEMSAVGLRLANSEDIFHTVRELTKSKNV